MGHDDAWSPLEKGLSVRKDSLADSWVAHVPYADVSGQSFKFLVVENILDQTESAVAGEVVTSKSEDPARVLSTVLNGLQRRTQVASHGAGVNNSSETAHREGL
jgi:hypothetical protein